MFIYDKPIETEKDDFLGRTRFSYHLSKALLDWKEKESLVIAIYGEWGSGKSSVINLARENIEKSDHENKPTVIEFNPWIFSEEASLGGHFFNEIAKELEIRNDSVKDKKIAKQLKFYASILSLVPEKNLLSSLSSKTLLILGLIGITSSQIIGWLSIPNDWIQKILFVAGLIFLLVELFKGSLTKFADYFEKKADYYSKSIFEVKREIKEELIKRQKKLVIVIDDIDRLNQSEIKQIFRLIRVNADFPNTIYLLSFDRKIIEKNLEEQVGVSGKEYLNKIIQVNFDLPFAKSSKIQSFLFLELDRILGVLPDTALKYFGQDDPYWANVYNSGFKDFFKNIRDVKRFASSLEFNISQMYQGKIMEVNPIDFIAIEAIRIFVPDFYNFMKGEKNLFTDTESNRLGESYDTTRKRRKERMELGFNLIHGEEDKSLVKTLIFRLFPQIGGICDRYGNTSYGHDWQSTWSADLRICATKNFDSYFTLIPGGDEEELSQYEIEEILSKANSEEDFEKILREYINRDKIRKVLQRIQDFTSNSERIPQDNVKFIVQALFNISDDLPEEKVGIWDYGIDMDLMRIAYQLLKRETDKAKNVELLKEAIPLSKGLFGPVQKVSLESSRKKRGRDTDEFLVPEDKLEELQKLCLEKIKSTNNLLEHKNLLYILYRWKEWDKEEKWKDFIKQTISDDIKLLLFMGIFVSKISSQTFGDYGFKIIKKFNYKSLSDFVDLSEIKMKLENIKNHKIELYQNNREAIDLFLDNFENKDKEDLD